MEVVFKTPLFRYQEVFLGSFVVFISNDVYNIINGFFRGAMIPVVILWFLGFFSCFHLLCIMASCSRIHPGSRSLSAYHLFFLLGFGCTGGVDHDKKSVHAEQSA